ncbi:MAG: hypothetical protein US13_C0001G0063 [candidate division TM6 bacterium GW2011_GWE2_36_25]|nr:MAG: hypothetical protein US03_C0001G0141 [candidate division TM6 bacterium GW2011_GWF2_36_131]KKQ03723.1 MAG: hypothetical protein US13_C0001G0063 [candidate division TM6 bacterium GW2011_GWE2_36_25]KKQ20041.1 MAG: hypothetical protein US32_C0002G0046 [candidate division TM6 bacterium GW2011_GWA2_36_9]
MQRGHRVRHKTSSVIKKSTIKKSFTNVQKIKNYLLKALEHRLAIQQEKKKTPRAFVGGLWLFLDAEGQKAVKKRIFRLESSSKDFPPSHESLCEFYLKKAKDLIRQAESEGDEKVLAVARVISDFDLEALLMGKVIKKSPVPEGMFN